MKIKKCYYIIKFTFLYIWYHIFKRNRHRLMLVDEDFIHMMEYACEDKDVEIDMKSCTLVMNTRFFNEHLCDGAYSQINDTKAKLFFKKIRQWINISRGYCNGAMGTDYPSVGDGDRINFGVKGNDDNIYIVGYDEGNLLHHTTTNTTTMKEIHRSKMLMLFHDKQQKPKNVRINYCTQDGRRMKDVLVRITSVQDHGHHINVVLPETNDKEHRQLLDTLVLDVDGVRVR